MSPTVTTSEPPASWLATLAVAAPFAASSVAVVGIPVHAALTGDLGHVGILATVWGAGQFAGTLSFGPLARRVSHLSSIAIVVWIALAVSALAVEAAGSRVPLYARVRGDSSHMVGGRDREPRGDRRMR